METLTLNIEGMTCGGCVKSVTRILESVEGVAKAEVSLEGKSALIELDPAKTRFPLWDKVFRRPFCRICPP